MKFFKDDLCPILGSFEKSERRSIVVLDNATVHMLPEVKEAIHAAGAYLLYTASYSPDLNPIEKMFSVYKATLKRNEELDWLSRHELAVASVTPYKAGKFYKKCGVPLCGVRVDDVVEEFVVGAGAFVSTLVLNNVI